MNVWIPKYICLCLALCVALAGATSVGAGSPTEYRTSIENARELVGEMLIELAEDEAGIAPFDHGPKDTADFRKILPVAVKVESPNGNVEVSFQWLHSKLDEFDKTSDLQDQAHLLTEIEERLAAMAWSHDEFENAAAKTLSKDEEKQKLNEILNREEFQSPEPPKESLLEQWFMKIGDWISSLFPSRGPSVGSQGMGSITSVLQIGLIVVVLAIVAFGIYKLAPLLFPAFKRIRKEKRSDRVILGEVIEADRSATSLFEEAEILARNGELRNAIRKGYIAALCELSDKKVIGLARHKTNRDYLNDVRKNAELHSNLKGLTVSFEDNWYGSAPSAESAWVEFRQRYAEAIKSI